MKALWRAGLILVSAIGLNPARAGETIYFLVSEPKGRIVHNDSYILPLSNVEDVEYARYLLQRNRLGFLPGDRTIVVGWAVAGKDGINRNYRNPKFPEWSWHVRFSAFAEITHEILDGNPTYLERFDWSGTGEAPIGFWDYTVVGELGSVPLYCSILPHGQDLKFYWSGLGTNYVYTLEGNESLASTNWWAVPGAMWPLQTNHWALAMTNAFARFFRVRAEPSNP